MEESLFEVLSGIVLWFIELWVQYVAVPLRLGREYWGETLLKRWIDTYFHDSSL